MPENPIVIDIYHTPSENTPAMSAPTIGQKEPQTPTQSTPGITQEPQTPAPAPRPTVAPSAPPRPRRSVVRQPADHFGPDGFGNEKGGEGGERGSPWSHSYVEDGSSDDDDVP